MIPLNAFQKVCEATWYLLVSVIALRWSIVRLTSVVEQQDGFCCR